MNRQRGFTLIELVVVVSIIAILAAVCAGASMVHSRFLTRAGVVDPAACPGGDDMADNTTTICTEAGIVNIVNGYPQALAPGNPGVISAAGLTGIVNPTAAQFNAEGYGSTGGGAVAGSALVIQVIRGATPANCSFTYTAPAAADAAAVIGASTTTGC